MILKVLAFVFLIPGLLTAFSARWIVDKYNLADKMKCEHEDEMNEDEIRQYKSNKAMINIKMLGMLIALPGLALVVIAFK